MKVLLQIVTSSIGKKILMGLSGIALAAFIVIHTLGNLQIFLGSNTLNAYAALLKASNEVLWGFRICLLLTASVHILAAIGLVHDNWRGRPIGYKKERSAASLASRTMIYSGLIVLAFLVFHILHFTVGTILHEHFAHNLPPDAAGRPDVYSMVVQGFSIPWVSAFYIISVALLSWHLSHGVGSMFQTLGLRNKRSAPFIDAFAILFAVFIFLGMSAVPTAVLLKIVS
ncbi:MAG: succinate dehydrogenase cytochrome b subunit [Methylacidiphilales bacterium]|nr:succinate dehydrogenase cytochrome b subunit [Candidatus Methylacidiphilales bacterium]